MKTRHKIALVALFLFCAGLVVVGTLMAKDHYMRIECPMCSSTQVIDCGYDIHGDAHGHCLDCGSDVTVYGYAPD